MTVKKEVETNKSPAAIGPYSQAIEFNNLVMTSGQIGLNADGKLVSEDVEAQTEQSLKNIKEILKKIGTGIDNVVKCSIFVNDLEDFSKVNEVYKAFFNKPYPARSCVEVARLPKDVEIEIEAIAVKNLE